MIIEQRLRIAKDLKDIVGLLAHKYTTEQNTLKTLNSIIDELEKE